MELVANQELFSLDTIFTDSKIYGVDEKTFVPYFIFLNRPSVSIGAPTFNNREKRWETIASIYETGKLVGTWRHFRYEDKACSNCGHADKARCSTSFSSEPHVERHSLIATEPKKAGTTVNIGKIVDWENLSWHGSGEQANLDFYRRDMPFQ